jgi:FAD/FMN-containing dehydrogenase
MLDSTRHPLNRRSIDMTLATSTNPTVSAFPASAPDLKALQGRLTGDAIDAASEAYNTARKVFDITVDRRPLAIVRAATTADVVEAVLFVRRHDLPLAVRSGAHSLAGYGTVDGGIVVDLSAMRGVTIDPQTRTARVQPGATSGDLAGPAHAYGLALSTGDASTVGLGGLTTGGGIGFMVRKYGLAVDNLLSAEVVTADGRVRTASATENPDLFWAIRGGGGNFGIITEFTFQLAPVGQVLGGALVLPATREVIRGYLDYIAVAPDDLTTITNFMHAPPAPFIPEDRLGEPVMMILVCWTGDMEEGERVIAPLRALATPVADTVAPIPYPVIYNYTEESTKPHGVAIRSMYANEISDETIDAIIAGMEVATSPVSMVQFRGLGGAMARVPVDATAFAHRDKQYQVTVLGLWQDPNDDQTPHRAWAESLWQKIRHDASGVYVNFLSKEGQARIRDAYPSATYERLVGVKRAYDPSNFFRLNQNIDPRG